MVLIAALLGGAAAYVAAGGLSGIRRLEATVTASAGAIRPRFPALSKHAVAAWWPPARRRATQDRRAAVIELCRALVVELRAGGLPVEALVRAAAVAAEDERITVIAPRAVAAARSGLDVVAALRIDAASQPGAAGLRALAACLHVASDTGAGLAEAISRVHTALVADEERRDRVATELAAPRATAWLLAALPLLGLGLGHAIGADPLSVLLGTGWGRVIAVLGVGLNVAGFLWVAALARRAERVS